MATDTATAALYVMFNIASSLGIVFANKAVFAVFHFPYPLMLTLIHICFTAVGMQVMAAVRSPRPNTRSLASSGVHSEVGTLHTDLAVPPRKHA